VRIGWRCGLTTIAALLAAATAGEAVESLDDLKPNTWTPVGKGAGYAYSLPVYVPRRKQVLLVPGAGGRNDVRAFDAKTLAWASDYESDKNPPQRYSEGGMLRNAQILPSGKPPAMLTFDQVACDSKRKRIVIAYAGLTAAYDPEARTWTDLKSKVVLDGKEYPGAPPVCWGAMAYDPVNDELVMPTGLGVFNWDHWKTDREVTGAFGTFIYSFATNTWTRPALASEQVVKARAVVRGLRLALHPLMRRVGDCIILDRAGKADDAKTALAAATTDQQALAKAAVQAAADLKTIAKGEDAARITKAAEALGEIEQGLTAAAKAMGAGDVDAAYRSQFDALHSLRRVQSHILYTTPTPRGHAKLTYDPRDKCIVLYGGNATAGHVSDIWVYWCEKRRWEKREPQIAPPPREMPLFAFHPPSGTIVMGGGYTSYWANPKDQRRDMWTYDVAANTWQRIPGSFPIKRGVPSYYATYDAADDAFICVRNGGETFAYRFVPGAQGTGPGKASLATTPTPAKTPYRFEVPRDDPAVVEKLKGLPGNTWVNAKCRAGGHDWGKMEWDPVLNCAVIWGGGHSTGQWNGIRLYFPGADRTITAYRGHVINLAPWNKACGNPGGVDPEGGCQVLHGRGAYASSAGTVFFTLPTFSPFWYGPDYFRKLRTRWGKGVTNIYDLFSRQWVMPETRSAPGLIKPDAARRTVVGMGRKGAVVFNRETRRWDGTPTANALPVAIGEGAGIIYLEKRNALFAYGSRGKDKPAETWLCDLRTNTWTDLKPAAMPPQARTSALVYLPDSDAVFAGLFNNFGKKTFTGDEWVYSFEHTTWKQVPSKATLGKKWPLNKPPGAYHSAWTKLAYDPKHGVLVRPGWVMRPDLDAIEWDK